jgi:serine/threonine protein kinase
VEDDRGRLQILKLITDITEDAPALASLLDQVRHALPPHPALLPVTEVGTSDEGVYLASPVLTAPSVDGRLRGGRQSLEATLPWLRAVTAGLQAAHDAGVWHGAIHPRDVLVTDDGGVLTGVGIAPVLEHLKLQAPVRVPFTAPERASGRAWDARADQYSLAMLALDALSGRRLIAGTIPAFDRWTLAETPTEDARLHDVFVRALDPDPNQRYASVEEWLAALAGPDRLGESGALSRFARDGVILAGPLAGVDAAREIKVQTIDDQKGDSLSLFPEESTVESQVVESAPPHGAPADAPDASAEHEQEQEWLVADVPDEATSVEPEAEPFAIRYAPAPAVGPSGPDTPARDWSLDHHDRADAADTTGMFASAADESPSRSPWLLAAVMLVLVALGYGTWRSLQAPSAPAASTQPPTGLSTEGDGAVTPPAEPTSPAPRATEPAGRPTPPPATSKAVPQAPVSARPTQPATRPATPAPAEPSTAVAAASAGTGRVLIRSSPSGEVRVNGTVRGETPVVLRDLPYGVYAIAIARPGFEPVEREITLLASQPVASLSVDLRRQGAGGPPPAPEPAAPVPSPSTPAGAGAAASSASAPARPAPAAVATEPTGAPPVTPAGPSAPQATGGIFVTSTPSQARLFVDGQAYGSTPASVPGLTVGAHTVRVEAPGYRPWEGRVAVLAGTRVRVTATLQQEQE